MVQPRSDQFKEYEDDIRFFDNGELIRFQIEKKIISFQKILKIEICRIY